MWVKYSFKIQICFSSVVELYKEEYSRASSWTNKRDLIEVVRGFLCVVAKNKDYTLYEAEFKFSV